jgi:hypothetical protein
MYSPLSPFQLLVGPIFALVWGAGFVLPLVTLFLVYRIHRNLQDVRDHLVAADRASRNGGVE